MEKQLKDGFEVTPEIVQLWEDYIRLAKGSVSITAVDDYIRAFSNECDNSCPGYNVRLYVYFTRLIEDSLQKILNKHIRIPFTRAFIGEIKLTGEEVNLKLESFKAETEAFINWLCSIENFKFSKDYIDKYIFNALAAYSKEAELIQNL